MKKIEAIIREEKLEAVKKSLEDVGYMGITITEVAGRGHQKGLALQWRAGEYRVDLLPKLKVEVVVMDEDVSKVATSIINAARTGEMGDGKIFVSPVENAIRIRTGEDGINAV
jgi:nitrogen regulatory protein P-II 1